MAYYVILEVPITVNTEEQAQLIFDSVASGLAEQAIKDRVLFGGSGGASSSAPTQGAPASSVKQAEADTQLQRVATAAPKQEVIVTAKEERARGVLGRKRPDRLGGR